MNSDEVHGRVFEFRDLAVRQYALRIRPLRWILAALAVGFPAALLVGVLVRGYRPIEGWIALVFAGFAAVVVWILERVLIMPPIALRLDKSPPEFIDAKGNAVTLLPVRSNKEARLRIPHQVELCDFSIPVSLGRHPTLSVSPWFVHVDMSGKIPLTKEAFDALLSYLETRGYRTSYVGQSGPIRGSLVRRFVT
jgi:hypothetical protein